MEEERGEYVNVSQTRSRGDKFPTGQRSGLSGARSPTVAQHPPLGRPQVGVIRGVLIMEIKMTVKELREFLSKYPDNLEIVNGRCSDYEIISEDEWSIIKGVPKQGWVMTSHLTMSEENKKEEKEYLALAGN